MDGSDDDVGALLTDFVTVSAIVDSVSEVTEDDIVDVVMLYLLEDGLSTKDDVPSIETDTLDDDGMIEDIVVHTTLDEVPLVVFVITLGVEDIVMYEVENVLIQSDTVTGVTTEVSVNVEDAVNDIDLLEIDKDDGST